MLKNIISIDEDKCVGCGLCVNTCHQDALQLINGKAKLVSESYCDGLGRCLPNCPTNALKIIEIECVEENKELSNKKVNSCESHKEKIIEKSNSALNQWPCQLKLVMPTASFLKNSLLLIAADCAAFAYKDFHNDFMEDKVTLIGCPKLDETDYSEKISQIIKINNLKDINVAIMEVPCCKGLENAVMEAIKKSGNNIKCTVSTISIKGQVI